MNTLKIEINRLVENQRFLKNQRKTVHLVGERSIEPWNATFLHHENRHQLRLLYATYHVLRGKDLETFETKVKENNCKITMYQRVIDKLIEKYAERKEEVVCVD